MSDKTLGRVTGGVLVSVILIVLFFMAYSPVTPGHTGVKIRLKSVQHQSLHSGPHWKIPFLDSIEQVNTQLSSYAVDTNAPSKDLQIVHTQISMQHSLVEDFVPDVYEKIGGLDKVDTVIITPAVAEAFKAVTAKYRAEELVTMREKVKHETEAEIRNYIQHSLSSKGLDGALMVSNFAITDFDFSAGFNAAIEAKVKAQQESLRAVNEKERRITEAEASAREKELAAKAEAFTIEQVSVQRAAALKREAEALTANPSLIQLRAIEKWNGVVPTINGVGPVPFLDLKGGK